MMDNLRAAANHVALKIILVLIIISFVFTGISGYLFNSGSESAVKINGQTIPQQEIEKAFMNAKLQLIQSVGQDKGDELLSNTSEMKRLRQQAIQQVINRELIRQYAQTLKLGASNEQIKAFIRAIPIFKDEKTGQFANQLYQNYLTNAGMNSNEFADMIRSIITADQLDNIFQTSEFILPNEIETFAKFAYQKRKIRLMTIDVNTLKATQTISDAEIEAYYQQNDPLFTVPEKIKVAYVPIDEQMAHDSQPISTQAINDYYQANKNHYLAQNYTFSIIKIKDKNKAQQLLNELQAGADFAELARANSLDSTSAINGGQLAPRNQYQLTPAMQQASTMNKGQISPVIAEKEGFVIIKLDDVQIGEPIALTEIEGRIRNDIQQERNQQAFIALQEKAEHASQNDPYSLVDVEKATGIKIITTDWLNENNLPDDLNLPELKISLFNGSLLANEGGKNVNSPLLKISSDRAYILRIVDHQPALKKPLDEVRAQIITTLTQQKALEQALAQANNLQQLLQTAPNEQEALVNSTLKFSAEQVVDRETTPIIDAFNIVKKSQDKPGYGVAMDKKGNVVVIALDQIIAGDRPENAISNIEEQQLLNIQRNSNQESLLESLYTQAKIKVANTL